MAYDILYMGITYIIFVKFYRIVVKRFETDRYSNTRKLVYSNYAAVNGMHIS